MASSRYAITCPQTSGGWVYLTVVPAPGRKVTGRAFSAGMEAAYTTIPAGEPRLTTIETNAPINYGFL
jgi:hypothetical protein